MTFDLSAQQEQVRERARAFAQKSLPSGVAAELDRPGARVPDEFTRAASDLLGSPPDPLLVVVVVEEIATASGAVALAAIPGNARELHDYAGLRGASIPEDSARTQLGLAALSLGVGRAALTIALDEIRRATSAPGQEEKPHWVAADVATEIDAARLLTWQAAQAVARGRGETEVPLARLMASAAARRAVDAALRIAGPDSYRSGGVLERLTRDVRTLSLILGTEERLRTTAAEGMFSGG